MAINEFKFDEKFFKLILDILYDAIFFYDKNRKIIYWNQAAEKLTGYKKEEIINSYCYNNTLFHTNIKGEYLCNNDKCPILFSMNEKKIIEEKIFLKHKEGYRIPVLSRISPVIDEKGNVLGAVEVFSDNSAKLSAFQKIEKLQKLAFIDSLTGIGNRRYTEIKIATRIEELKKFGIIKRSGILFIDIDHFKKINDMYGHKFGDNVLKIIAKTILKNIRENDFVGRWGGEEFIVVVSNVDKNELIIIAEKLRLLIQSMYYRIKEDVIKLSVSIGATIIKENDEMESLINRADSLMYKCKNSGRNCVHAG